MAKVHRSYRLEEETVQAVAEWAEAHNLTATQAVEQLLVAGMREGKDEDGAEEGEELRELRRQVAEYAARAEAWDEQKAILGESLKDARTQVYTLTSQLAVKDAQIARAHDLAEHAQALQMAHVRGAIGDGTEPKEGWRGRLARWIGGRE